MGVPLGLSCTTYITTSHGAFILTTIACRSSPDALDHLWSLNTQTHLSLNLLRLLCTGMGQASCHYYISAVSSLPFADELSTQATHNLRFAVTAAAVSPSPASLLHVR